ncbi:MAG: hypothetical protein AB1408_00125 [Pseudomonadota bacterium]
MLNRSIKLYLDGISITYNGEQSMSNDPNKRRVPESSFDFCAERLVKTLHRRRFLTATAGGMAACIAAPLHAFASQNPVINQAGSAIISSSQYCTWNTASGRNSILTIVNSSRTNNLTIAITNAPSSGITVQLNGQVQQTLNNIFTLPPNSPSYEIVATGNFGSRMITITNITNMLADASASIQVLI